MVATQLPSSPDMQMASYLAYAGQASEHMYSAHAETANQALIGLTRAPVQAQQTAMESAIAQAASSIDLSSLNISGAVDPSEVRLEVAGNNADKGRDGIA